MWCGEFRHFALETKKISHCQFAHGTSSIYQERESLRANLYHQSCPAISYTNQQFQSAREAAQFLIDNEVATGLVVSASRYGAKVQCSIGHDRPAGETGAGPLHSDTVFNVGSVTKCITGTLLAEAVADGAVDLDTPVQRYLPQYANADDTVRRLATHTAGYAFNQIEPWPDNPEQLADFRGRVYALREKRLTPEVKMAYWSNGYFVLMELLEEVLSAPIESIAMERIFVPCGMERTTFLSARAYKLGRVLPFDAKANRRLVELTDAPPIGETGLWTTAPDLLRFAKALLSGEAFRRRTMELISIDQSRRGHLKTLGFWLRPTSEPLGAFAPEMSGKAIGHPGYTGCFLGLDPENGFAVAIASPNTRMQSNFGHYAMITSAVWRELYNN